MKPRHHPHPGILCALPYCTGYVRREWQRDRYIEAILGGRLRFHGYPELEADLDAGYAAIIERWRLTYDRWSELYRAGGPPMTD